ncbi:MAG: prepilin-type N-terminal cleavage/methylation domain-containing protein [Agathobacter sp.]|uniref:prepilin-type N-terminal cleavage/methylation domain-containing protein n=1 Tax=Agathobacter sp. TaxID=2021311 RepID=UPI002E7896C1|nr:prepilin-type N-terminal cleavage/methylation domain-containing protein [Agathobacter sp.]MEE1216424.1 prepilin-type N-terminal cleavage/methylation domain-containing protein [Agathobacter sp.]
MVKNVLNTLRKKQKNNKGFSLVELIVVIAIMAVLVGVLAPQFIKYVERSRQSTDLQNVEELKNAVEVTMADADDDAIADAVGADGKPAVGADGKPTKATITIKIENGKAKLEGITPKNLGKTEVSLKSKGWNNQTYTYNPTDSIWTTDAKADETQNKKDPNRDMADVFSTTGSET